MGVTLHTHLPDGSTLQDVAPEWIHVYPGSGAVPPVGYGGSFNYLIWDLLQRHPSHAFVGRYNPASFEKAVRHQVSVLHLDDSPAIRMRDRIRRLARLTSDEAAHPHWRFMEEASRIISALNCDQLMVWGDLRVVRKLRRRFPRHTIVYAQRNFVDPSATTSLYNELDVLLVLSEGVARFTYEKWSELHPVVLATPNGVELETFAPPGVEEKTRLREQLDIPPQSVVVIVPSKIHGNKGANFLYRWIRQCQRDLPGLVFLLMGGPSTSGGTQRGDKAKLIDLMENAPNVRRVGPVARTEMPQFYKAADFSLIPSVWREGMSMAALESLASGLPLVTTRRGIFPEIVQHDKTGWLCRPEKLLAEGLEALKILTEDRVKRREMSEAARAYAEHRLSRERCLGNFDAFFRGEWSAIDNDLSPLGRSDAE